MRNANSSSRRRGARPGDAGYDAALREKRALQVVLAVLSAIPLFSGLAGMLTGTRALRADRTEMGPNAESEYRFLNAIWFALAPLIWWLIPQIENRGAPTRALGAVIVAGGGARVLAWRANGRPNSELIGALGLELAGIPAVVAWQTRVARRARQLPLASDPESTSGSGGSHEV